MLIADFTYYEYRSFYSRQFSSTKTNHWIKSVDFIECVILYASTSSTSLKHRMHNAQRKLSTLYEKHLKWKTKNCLANQPTIFDLMPNRKISYGCIQLIKARLHSYSQSTKFLFNSNGKMINFFLVHKLTVDIQWIDLVYRHNLLFAQIVSKLLTWTFFKNAF